MGLPHALVIAPASHDTGSAVAAVPFEDPGAAYISSGTWSLVGVEVRTPILEDRARRENFTNEGGVGGTFVPTRYAPASSDRWEAAYHRFVRMLSARSAVSG